MMDVIRERERQEALSPEKKEIEKQERLKKIKESRKKRYDEFTYINNSSDRTNIDDIYKTYSENDENAERKRKQFDSNSDKTVFIKEWCKNNKNEFCLCNDKINQKEWNKKCNSYRLNQDASLVDKYNYLCSNINKCDPKTSDCKQLELSCKQNSATLSARLQLIPKSYISDPITQKSLKIFSYKGDQDGFVFHRVMDTEKYLKQIQLLSEQTQFLKDYIKQLKEIQSIVNQWKFNYKQKIYEQLNEFKDDLQQKIDEMEQLLKKAPTNDEEEESENKTVTVSQNTTTNTNNETTTSNDMSFGKKHHHRRRSHGNNFSFYHHKRHHQHSRDY